MIARRTIASNAVFELIGGTEDNHLWVERSKERGYESLKSTWVPTDSERLDIANGANIMLETMGSTTPPLMMYTTNIKLGKRHDQDSV